MNRLLRFASTAITSLSLALIVLATLSGGEAQAAGFAYCGTSGLYTGPDGIEYVDCSDSCVFGFHWCQTDRMYPFSPLGSQCGCYVIPRY